MTTTIYIFEGISTKIQCSKEQKMKFICDKYCNKINENINSLLFLYGGTKLDMDKKFEEYSKENTMKILVYKNNTNNGKLNLNSDEPLKQSNSIYYLILFLSICFNCNMYRAVLPPIIDIVYDEKNDLEMKIVYYFIIICFDAIFGLCLLVTEKFINYRIIIILSLILLLFDTHLSLSWFLGLKMLKSSIFYIIPIWNNKIIEEINIGEIISNIILYFIYSKIKLEKEKLNINYIYNISNSIIIIYTLIIFIYNNSLFSKFIKKEEERKKLNNNKINYLKKNGVFNILIASNFCFSYSFYPLLIIFTKYEYSYSYIYAFFVIFDAIGRFLFIQFQTKIEEEIFKAIIFFRFIIIFILPIFLPEVETIYEIIFISTVSFLSGICTSFAYYYPLNIKDESKRDDFIYSLKSGKYYIIFKLFDESDEKKNL